ncbi:hypothetical protein EDD36DRAFT_470093 [Exophiala viscosa]|uniref:Uncharacterized protein n=1 Tax=Exophiala viscosa TaxID=2486360 RepID=A0AAN6E422_9EURO|nr:hypothetical protein EDD36DRAFT_470093 [Exophiala viscosa]
MTLDLILTILFGVLATAIVLITIWQNFQIVQVKVERLSIALGMHSYRILPWIASPQTPRSGSALWAPHSTKEWVFGEQDLYPIMVLGDVPRFPRKIMHNA